jgi:flagellar motor switch protein FliG
MKDLFLKNLSERAGKMLREEMEGLGPVRLLDVEDARTELVRIAKDLNAQGKIEIKQSGDEEVVD